MVQLSKSIHLNLFKEYLNEKGVNKEYIKRFHRIASLYGYDEPNRQIAEFLTLVLDSPTAFKDDEKILHIWKSPSTIKEMFRSLNTVVNVQGVNTLMGDKQKMVVDHLNTYKQHILNLLERKDKNQSAQKATMIQMINDTNVHHPQEAENNTLRRDLFFASSDGSQSATSSSSHDNDRCLKNTPIRKMNRINKSGKCGKDGKREKKRTKLMNMMQHRINKVERLCASMHRIMDKLASAS